MMKLIIVINLFQYRKSRHQTCLCNLIYAKKNLINYLVQKRSIPLLWCSKVRIERTKTRKKLEASITLIQHSFNNLQHFTSTIHVKYTKQKCKLKLFFKGNL